MYLSVFVKSRCVTLQCSNIMACNSVAQETSLSSQWSTHLPRIGTNMVVDQFCTSERNARAPRLPLGEGTTILECSGSSLSKSLFTPHDTRCAAVCSKKSRHAPAHLHVLHVFIVCSFQCCVRRGAVGPLAVAPQGTPCPIPSQAVCRSLYKRTLDVNLAIAILLLRVSRVHPRSVYACQLGVRRITV